MTRIISIVNQKGGVGKTTTTINLATAFSACHKKTLVIDLDSQGNASTGLGVDDRHNIVNSFDLLLKTEDYKDADVVTEVSNLSIIPASMELARVEQELSKNESNKYRFKDSLESYLHKYDYIFLDCPPNLGLVTLNALHASTDVIIPLQAEFYALEGLAHILKTIEEVQDKINSKLSICGILLTMYSKSNNLSLHVAEEVRNHFSNIVFNTVIPRNIRVAEAPSFGKPVMLHDYKSTGSIAYMLLAKELLKKFSDV